MKKTIALVLMAAVWLGGCSGRTDENAASDSNDPLDVAAAQATPGQVRVLTTSPSLQTGAAGGAEIIAIVTDDNNRVVADQEILFSADGGVLQNIVSTTTESGEATATLNLAGDYRNRNVTVTARLGDLVSTVLVAATGTEIEMSAPDNLIIGDTPELEIRLQSGDGQAIPNQLVTLASSAGNTFDQNSVVTDANGSARVAISTTQGADTITATALDGTVLASYELNVVENSQAVVTPVRIRVISNESAIETGGNDMARITTLVTDDNNRVISGKAVEFSSTGGVLQNISDVTNAAGQATAELSLAGDYRNQEIVVTARVDEQEGSVRLTTSGSVVTIAGPTSLVNGDVAELEITLTGGNGQAIANELVSITSAPAGNTLSSSTVTTDAAGKATVTVVAQSNGTISVSALNSTVLKEHTIRVAADILTVQDRTGFDDPASPAYNDPNYQNINVDTPSPYTVLWQRNGVPVVGEPLKFTITAGEVRAVGSGSGSGSVVVDTDQNGLATIEVKSKAAGPATIAYSDARDADPFSQFDVEFVAVDVSNVAVEAAPASVATGNASTIFAVVTDDFGNPVKNVAVEFSSPNLKGGTLSPVTAVTDSEGKARITFTAGSIASEQNELIIRATASDFPDVSSAVSLTVTERQLNVIIGLSGSLSEADSDTRYRKAGLVQVTDGAGRPVPDATIIVSMIPTIYRYGRLRGVDTDNNGEADAWARLDRFTYACNSEDTNNNRILDTPDTEDTNGNGILDLSEDTNQNGLLDTGEDTNGNGVLDLSEDINQNGRLDINEDSNGNGVFDIGEDANNNGRLDIGEDVNNYGVLDPSDPGLVDADPVNSPSVLGGQITTDANGVGFFSMAYPQSNAQWFDVRISARVQALGVEVVSEYDTGLQVLVDDVNDIEVTPPNAYSPYGELDLDAGGNVLLTNGRPSVNGLLITCDQPSTEVF